MYTIHLHQLKFHAPVGIYEEEQLLGNHLEFSMEVQMPEPHQYESINDTLNYELLFHIVASRMKQPTQLLETMAADIIESAHQSFPSAIQMQVSIIKKNPPISGCRGDVGITISKTF